MAEKQMMQDHEVRIIGELNTAEQEGVVFCPTSVSYADFIYRIILKDAGIEKVA